MQPEWRVRGGALTIDRPIVVGILNVTPDSFSDGGSFLETGKAVEHGLRMLDHGADIIDVGGESTRPQGAIPVSAAEEERRVLPVVAGLARRDTVISIDTVKSSVARAALDAGASIVNDVSAMRLDPEIGPLCASTGAGLILMHSRGGVTDMATYALASYDDVVADVLAELRQRVATAQDAGVSDDRIVVDPGIGFAKKSAHSLALLAALPHFAAWGYPVMVGVSRKRFIGELTGAREPADRLSGTVGANVAALARGARIFRVHDVAENRQALDVAWRILK